MNMVSQAAQWLCNGPARARIAAAAARADVVAHLPAVMSQRSGRYIPQVFSQIEGVVL